MGQGRPGAATPSTATRAAARGGSTSRDGKIVREEQAGVLHAGRSRHPRHEPDGLPEGRVLEPLPLLARPRDAAAEARRRARRGQVRAASPGTRRSTDIADAMLDAIEEQGPESILTLLTPEPGAAPARQFALAARHADDRRQRRVPGLQPRLCTSPGACSIPTSSMDDWFLAELTLIWHANPVYTNIHWYHYLAESRYNGGEVVTIAPDYSPSAIHADYHLPVRIGTDAALALAMCKVIIDAGLYQKQFVQEQTDLPLLVRKDNGRFLRGTDLNDGEREDQFFWWDTLDQHAHAGAAAHAGDDRRRSGARGQLPGHAQGRQDRGGRAGLRAAAAAPRGLRRRRRRRRSARCTRTTSAASRARWPRGRRRSSSAGTRASTTTAT